MVKTTAPTGMFVIALLAGCAYDENLPSEDLTGVVRLPKEALETLTLSDPVTGEPNVVDDLRAVGPVYIGAYASVETGDFDYPHPEMGPILDKDLPGDTYPYGGTSVGRFDWACYQTLVCKVVTGRFQSYDEIISFFADKVGTPITGPDGEEITDPDIFQERCFDAYYVTTNDELSFLNRPNDFVDKGDYYEAEVTVPHVNWVEGLSLWGWVDMPSYTFNFATCDPNGGLKYTRYSEDFYEGANQAGLLNYPSTFIDSGDWVVEDAPVITNPDDDFVLELGYHYVE